MTIKYYFRHCLWGLGGCGYMIYVILNSMHDGKIYPAYVSFMPFIAAYLAIGAVAYPFAFYVTERLSRKVMSAETWNAYCGTDSPSWGAFIFIYLFCVIFVLPLCIIYPFISKKPAS